MTFQFRMATVDDASAVASIHNSAWAEAYRGVLPATYLNNLDAEREAARLIAGGFPHFPEGQGFTLLAEDAKPSPIGYLQGGPSRQLKGEGEVYAIYLAPACWGTGLGQILWQKGVAKLEEKGFSKFSVWVFAANGRARSFYERQGGVLRRDEKVKNYGGKVLTLVSYHYLLNN